MTLAIVVGAIGWAALSKRGESAPDIEYRYGKVESGELIASTSATGILVPLTTVDIRSKAGGTVQKLVAEEGTVVQAGDIIALINPEDTKSVYDQARADVESAEARAEQAQIQAQLEQQTRADAVRDAENQLQIARVRLQRTESQAKVQPEITRSDVANNEASYRAALAAQRQLVEVEVPRMRNDARVSADTARANLDVAQAELDRQQELFKKDFVAQAAVERARSAYESARAGQSNAQERLRTVETEIDTMIRTQEARVAQAKAALAQSKANTNRDYVATRDVAEARRAVQQAEINLKEARDQLAQIRIRRADTRTARASIVRSKAQLENAQVQLDSTTVRAPRDGVITTKYLEEGTIIPPGTSTFSQGTAIVQLSDVSQMFVECLVDEADISAVKLGQNVRVIVEAFPGRNLKGKVTRINPAAATAQNITAVKVRVAVMPEKGVQLLPGMTSTCEFLTLEKPNVLIVPQQAVKREDGKTYVMVKSSDPKKPEKVFIELGEVGNDGFEVKSGLKAGAEVVTAEINLAEIQEVQRRMQQAQQGGGLSAAPQGGRPGGGGGGGTRTGGGGGARTGGGGR